MSAKPTTVPTWDTNGTNTIAITSAHASDGFVTDEAPASSEINQVLALGGQWDQYLSDGDLELATLKVDGATDLATLKVDGGTELAGSARCDADFTVVGPLDVQGAATFDGTGSVTFSGHVYDLNLRQSVLSYHLGYVAPAGSINSITPDGFTSASNPWTWESPYFGATGDLVTSIAAGIAAGSAAGTITWSLIRKTINTSTGISSTHTDATGTWTVTGGVSQYLTIADLAESTGYEPLAANECFLLQLSGTDVGIETQSALRYSVKRPAAV